MGDIDDIDDYDPSEIQQQQPQKAKEEPKLNPPPPKAKDSKKIDYYELLGVTKTATQDEISKGFRTQALIWHPDKNLHQADLASEHFKQLQNAYTVLKDPQERAWYDSHKEQILRGGAGASTGGSDDVNEGQDDATNLWPFFSSSSYNGYSDPKQGFYAVYSDLFETIAKEEILEADKQKSETPKTPTQQTPPKAKSASGIPSFGNSDTPYEKVKLFYDYWTNFASRRSFSWADKWKLTEAPDRKVKRLMEADNSKLRAKAKKGRNELIRQLAEFLRKRDKRVLDYKMQQQKKQEEQTKKDEEKKKQKQAEYERLKQEHKAKILAQWEEMQIQEEMDELEDESDLNPTSAKNNDDDDEDENEDQSGDEEEEEESDSEETTTTTTTTTTQTTPTKGKQQPAAQTQAQQRKNWNCRLCNKKFKSENAYLAHERSKQHQQKLKQTRKELLVEGEEEDDDDEESTTTTTTTSTPQKPTPTPTQPQNTKDKKSNNKQQPKPVVEQEDEEEEDLELEIAKKTGLLNDETEETTETTTEQEVDEEEEEMDDEQAFLNQMLKAREKKKKKQDKKKQKQTQLLNNDENEDDEENEEEGEEKVEKLTEKLKEMHTSKNQPKQQVEEANNNAPKSAKEKKARRADKKQQQVEAKPQPQKPANNDNENDDDEEFGCKVCGQHFDTRNALFKHVKKEGHAALKEK